MERVISDASVIVKWFIEEENSDKALKLRDKYINGEIIIAAPQLLPFEVLNALKYSNLFNKKELEDAATSLSCYGIELYPLKNEFARKSVKIALENNITIYDSSYIALAIILNSKLYTADEKLIEKLDKKYKKLIIHIAEFK